MADTSTSTIHLSEILAPEIQEAFNRSTTAAKILPVRLATNPAGPTWVVNEGGATAATHAEGATISTFTSDVDQKPVLGWGRYEQPFAITDEVMSDAALSPFPTASRQMFQREVTQAVATLAKKIENDLFSGSGSNSIIGFDTAIDDSNSYAGLNRGTEDYFRSYVSGSGTLAALTKAQIVDDLARIKLASGERPNLAFVNPLVFAKVESVFETQRRFVGGDASLGTAGVPRIDVFGCTFVETSGDGYASENNGAIYYVNTNHVHIEMIPYLEGSQYDAMALNGENVVDFFNFKKVPVAAHKTQGVVRCRAQLVVSNPITCGKRLDINLA